MPMFKEAPPISLYIHLPWCVQKCPYCDFNSHEAPSSLPEELYTLALLDELDNHLPMLNGRTVYSLFFGGGTPSLFSPQSIERILIGIHDRLSLSSDCEITLEANPGTIDQAYFRDFNQAGINRLSLGIQSLQNDKLNALGRIHDAKQAMHAIDIAKQAGFDNFNIDLMFGLPHQSITDAMYDLQTAMQFEPTHLSWYQLTIEPNTVFYKQTPPLPADDSIWEMQTEGQAWLEAHGFKQYEVSAYSQIDKQCRHNRNYWEFGDYLGIGAGAHSKITDIDTNTITRFSQVKQPRDYLDKTKRLSKNITALANEDIVFEFMLNALRLTEGFSAELFIKRTGLILDVITHKLHQAVQRNLLMIENNHIRPSDLGKKFLNNLVEMFLPNTP